MACVCECVCQFLFYFLAKNNKKTEMEMLRCKVCKERNQTVKLVKVGVSLCQWCDGGRRKTVPGLGHGRRRKGEEGGSVLMGEVEKKK